MKKIFVLVIVGAVLTVIYMFVVSKPPTKKLSTQIITMTITSPAFKQNESIPAKYTCEGNNTNPPLDFNNVPGVAKSLVLIMNDPDAPGGTWVHWMVWNIKPDTTEIKENSIPDGATEGITSFGRAGYGGPCPPSGTHRYFFKLYILDTTLNLPSTTIKSNLESAMAGHILTQAELVGLYQKKRN